MISRRPAVSIDFLVALAIALGVSTFSTANASADAGNCTSGLNTATTASGHCDQVGTPGYLDGFRLVVNCYYYPQQISYGTAGQSIYASCPSWSHVSGVFVEQWNG